MDTNYNFLIALIVIAASRLVIHVIKLICLTRYKYTRGKVSYNETINLAFFTRQITNKKKHIIKKSGESTSIWGRIVLWKGQYRRDKLRKALNSVTLFCRRIRLTLQNYYLRTNIYYIIYHVSIKKVALVEGHAVLWQKYKMLEWLFWNTFNKNTKELSFTRAFLFF